MPSIKSFFSLPRVLGAFLCAASLIAAPTALASGSSSGYSSSRTLTLPRATDRRYDTGKQIYRQALGCRSCPLAGKRLNKSRAKTILDDPQSTASLSAQDIQLVHYYLRKRFRLN